MATSTWLGSVQTMYVAYFGRPAAPTGRDYYAGLLDTAGGNYAALLDDFWNSTESQGLFNQTSTEGKVNAIFNQLFGRDALLDGLTYWTNQINTGKVSLPAAAYTIAYNAAAADTAVLNAKLTAADAFTGALDTTAEVLGYISNASAGRTFLSTVETDAQAAAAVADIDTTIADVVSGSNTNPGLTFTLTTGVDQGAAFAGTAGNDTFVAASSGTANAANTLNAADVINGGAGADVLNITVTATDTNTLGSAQISGIETINVRSAVAGQTATVAASSAVGATAVNSNAGAGALTVTALATGASVGIIGNGTVTNGAVTFDYTTATDAVTLNVSGGTKVGTTVATTANTPTSVTINSTGAANTLGAIDFSTGATVTALNINATTDFTATLAGDYAATAALTVTGAGKVDVGANGTFKTVDASANTGGLTMTLDTVTTSFKGSAANDTITTVTLAAPAAGIIDAGAGTGDKLIVAAAADVASAALRGSYTNFEVLANSAGASIAADGFTGITSLESSAAGGSFSAMTAAQAANILVSANQTAGVTYALASSSGTADVIGLTLGTGTTTAAATSITGGALNVTGFETLNIVANPGATATVGANKVSTIASLTGATLKAVNLSGSAVTITNAATTVAATFDASKLTGDGTVAGANGLNIGGSLVTGSTVIGSDFIDTVAIGAVGSTYNTGKGADVISATQAVIAGSIINGGEGVDTLTITDTANPTINDNTFVNVTGIEKFALGAFTGVNWVVGGYANAAATANGGVLDISAATSGTVANPVVIDASGLGAGNSLKLALTEITGVTAAGDMTITGSSGADNIKITTVATNLGDITINAAVGTAAKTVDLSGVAAAAAVTVTTGAGADVIKAAGVAGTYTGGLGADTFTAGAAVDTFAMSTNGSVIGTSMDKISGFGVGAGGDVLTFGGATTVLAADATATVAGANVQTSAGGVVTFAAADNTLALKIAAIQADAQLDAAGSVAVFEDSGNSYVYYAGAAIGNADDQLIELTGVTSIATITGGATTVFA